jgi:hypothetical protein
MTGDGTRPPLPTFVVVGAQKSATRWLRTNLGEHPDVFVAPQEVKYFDHPARVAALGPDWYRAQFAGWAGEPVVGEATPGYLMLRNRPAEVAGRIDATLPGVRLVALLRDPVERAVSALVHHKQRGRIHPRTRLLDHLRACAPQDDWMGIVAGGWYAASLEPYLARFGDRLLVELHDDVVADPAGVYRRVLAHVGATRPFVPPGLGRVVRSNRRAGDGDELTPQERAAAFEWFRDDVERLERLLGRDLTCWRPA